MTFFIYSRKSVFTGVGESTDNQIKMCKEYIYSKFGGGEISVFEDEGYSAKNTDRPEFQKMLGEIRKKPPDYVVCYRLDRISRSVSDFSSLIEELNSLEVAFVCIKEEFDTSKPMGKAMMYIASVFSQLERETIAERVRDNMLMLSSTGRWLGGTTPLGFYSKRIECADLSGKAHMFSVLDNDVNEIKIVGMIFKKYLESGSISCVIRYLNGNNIKTRNGTRFSEISVKQILKNPVYSSADKTAFEYLKEKGAKVPDVISHTKGIIAYNKRNYRIKNKPRQSMSEWVISVGYHKAIVSGKKWVAVQRKLEGEKYIKNTNTNTYSMLSGIIVCEICGAKRFAKRRSGKTANPNIFDYICENKLRYSSKVCASPNLSGRATDDAVFNRLCDIAEFDAINLSVTEKRELARILIQKIVCKNDKTDIYLN